MSVVHIFHNFDLAGASENKLALMTADSWRRYGWGVKFVSGICDHRLREWRDLFPCERDYILYHCLFRVPSLWVGRDPGDTLVFSHHDVINQGFRCGDILKSYFTFYMETRCNAVMSCDLAEYLRYREFILGRLMARDVHHDGFFYDEPVIERNKFGRTIALGYHSGDTRRDFGKFVHYVGVNKLEYFKDREGA